MSVWQSPMTITIAQVCEYGSGWVGAFGQCRTECPSGRGGVQGQWVAAPNDDDREGDEKRNDFFVHCIGFVTNFLKIKFPQHTFAPYLKSYLETQRAGHRRRHAETLVPLFPARCRRLQATRRPRGQGSAFLKGKWGVARRGPRSAPRRGARRVDAEVNQKESQPRTRPQGF